MANLDRISTDRLSRLARMSPNELASISEIATMLDVTKRTAFRWVNRPDFPEPIDVLEVGRIWSRADVEAWANANLPLKRGPAPRS